MKKYELIKFEISERFLKKGLGAGKFPVDIKAVDSLKEDELHILSNINNPAVAKYMFTILDEYESMDGYEIFGKIYGKNLGRFKILDL